MQAVCKARQPKWGAAITDEEPFSLLCGQRRNIPMARPDSPSVREIALRGNWLVVRIRYVTEADTVAELLPRPLVPGGEPLVTVFCLADRQPRIIGRSGHHIVGVNLAAAFRGQGGLCAGSYVAVLWENALNPAPLGCDMLGPPRLYADIPEPCRRGDHWSFECSLFGYRLIEAGVRDLSRLPPKELTAVELELNSTHWMGWRYMPRATWREAFVSHATTIPIRFHLREAWTGQGWFQPGETKWEDVLMSQPAMEVLRALPVIKYRDAMVAIGSIAPLPTQGRRLDL